MMSKKSKVTSTQEEVEHKDDEQTTGQNSPEPPDGGWGWIIVAASFLCHFVIDGIAYSFGVFLPKFEDFYNASKVKVSWVGSLLYGCYLISGPLGSALTNRYGCRFVTVIGSIVCCLAFLLSTQAPDVETLMVTCGIFGGIGFGLIFVPAIVSVGSYFSKKRALATGIAGCGSGVGSFAFAPLCHKLLEMYDWRGTIAILAGVCLSCMTFGAVMRPLEGKPREKMPLSDKSAENEEIHSSHDTSDSHSIVVDKDEEIVEKQSTYDADEISVHSLNKNSSSSVPMKNTVTEAIDEKQISTIAPLHSCILHILLHRSRDFLNSGCCIQSGFGEIYVTERLLKNKEGRFRFFFTGNESFYQFGNNCVEDLMWKPTVTDGLHSPLNITRHSEEIGKDQYNHQAFEESLCCCCCTGNLEQKSMFQCTDTSDVLDDISIPKDCVTINLPNANTEKSETCQIRLKIWKRVANTLANLLDFLLLQNKVFLLLCISNAVCMIGFLIPYLYIVDSSKMKGITSDNAAFLLSVTGVANMIGRLFFGCLSDRPGVSALFINNVSIALTGLCIMCMPFCGTYETLLTICVFFGFIASAFSCLTSIIVVELLGLEKLTDSFGLLLLFRGGASIVGPPIAGLLYDATGSYNIPFYIAGALLLLSSVISFMVPVVQKRFSEDSDDVPVDVVIEANHGNISNDLEITL